MKAQILFSAFLLLLNICPKVVAQDQAQPLLTEAQKEVIKLRIKQKLDDFQNHLKDIADFQLTSGNRDEALLAIKALFIGGCEPFQYYDFASQKDTFDIVKLWLNSNDSTQSVKKRLLKSYLKSLRNTIRLSPFPHNLLIQNADIVRVDNYYPTEDGEYECIAYMTNKYLFFDAEGNIRYSDIVNHKIRIKLSNVVVIPYEDAQAIADCFLGDIYANVRNNK